MYVLPVINPIAPRSRCLLLMVSPPIPSTGLACATGLLEQDRFALELLQQYTHPRTQIISGYKTPRAPLDRQDTSGAGCTVPLVNESVGRSFNFEINNDSTSLSPNNVVPARWQ